MIIRFILFALLSTSICYETYAQFSETIVSDRPGQSNSPYTAGKMVLQFQTGPQFDGGNSGSRESNSFSMPLMVRFGIADKVDLLTLWSYKREKEKSSSMEQTMNGINTADIGLRFNIFEETDKAPALGFEAFYKTELTSKDYNPNYPSAKLNLMTSKSISKLLSITANLGLDVAGQGGGSNGFYTFNLVFAISEHLSLFAENYGDFTYENINVFFDFGGAYLIGPNLQLDLYGGFGSNDGWSSSFVSGGISYRITSWRK